MTKLTNVITTRCVDYDGNDKKYTVFRFSCPPTLEFNEKFLVCSKPLKPSVKGNLEELVISIKRPTAPIPNLSTTVSLINAQPSSSNIVILNSSDSQIVVPATSTSAAIWTDFLAEPSTIAPTTPSLIISESSQVIVSTSSQPPTSQETGLVETIETTPFDTFSVNCTSNKFHRIPFDCNRFYQCYEKSISVFSCAPGLIFDADQARCSYPDESVECEEETTDSSVEELSDFIEIDCSGELLRYPLDCRRFYQCYSVNEESKLLLFFSCTPGLVFDEEKNKCLRPNETQTCGAVASPTTSTSFLSRLQKLFYSSPSKLASSF